MLSVLLLVAVEATKGPVVFGNKGDWYVVSRSAEVISSFGQIGGKDALDVAVSPDGKTFVFTAWDDVAKNPLLYRWRPGDKNSVLLGEPVGFHAAPSFTNDGKWVYFAHHPKKGGPPGQHEPGANAQLYRVRIDGARLQSLTDEPGCHMHPVAVDEELIVFAHADCSVWRSIELSRGSKIRGVRIDPVSGLYDSPTIDAKLQRIAYVGVNRVDSVIFEYDIKKSETSELARIAASPGSARLSYCDDGMLMFQTATGVTRRTASGDVEVVHFVGDDR